MSEKQPKKQILQNVPAPEPKTNKADRTRETILEGALDFLWVNPFRSLTVTELMSRTGASRSAFYQYFSDLHELMEALLHGMRDEIFDVARPWFQGEGDPVRLLETSLAGLVQVCFERGPILRAVSDAAPSDERLELAWTNVLKEFDEAVAERISEHQSAGLIGPFAALPVAIALNRMDAGLLIQQFGRRPRGDPAEVRGAITRIWVSTLYGEAALSQLKFEGDPPST